MARPTVDSLLSEPDAFALVALGLVSALDRFERRFAHSAGAGAAPIARDDPALLAALGLVSLSRTAARWVRAACPEAVPGEAASATALRELLR